MALQAKIEFGKLDFQQGIVEVGRSFDVGHGPWECNSPW